MKETWGRWGRTERESAHSVHIYHMRTTSGNLKHRCVGFLRMDVLRYSPQDRFLTDEGRGETVSPVPPPPQCLLQSGNEGQCFTTGITPPVLCLYNLYVHSSGESSDTSLSSAQNPCYLRSPQFPCFQLLLETSMKGASISRTQASPALTPDCGNQFRLK